MPERWWRPYIAGEFAARCSKELTARIRGHARPQVLDAYGLVAVFVAGVYLGRYEVEQEDKLRLPRSATIAKHFGELG